MHLIESGRPYPLLVILEHTPAVPSSEKGKPPCFKTIPS